MVAWCTITVLVSITSSFNNSLILSFNWAINPTYDKFSSIKFDVCTIAVINRAHLDQLAPILNIAHFPILLQTLSLKHSTQSKIQYNRHWGSLKQHIIYTRGSLFCVHIWSA